MGTFKDAYDILKDLIGLAQKAKNQDVVSLAMDVQAKLFELKEENETLRDENKQLKESFELNAGIVKDIDGFVTRESEKNPELRYCGVCWANERKLIPLTYHGSVAMALFCSKCKTGYGGNRGVSNKNYYKP